MQKLLFITLVYSLFWMACKKTEAPEGIDSPVFMVTYSGDSTPITVTAGLDGVYHFTHYTVVDQEFFHSINTFADAQCPAGDCPGSLGFEFRNQVNNDTAFSGGSYAYAIADTIVQPVTSYLTNFSWGQDLQHFPEQTLRIFGPDSVAFFPPLTSASLELQNNPYVISLETVGGGGLHSIVQRTIQPGNPDAYPAVLISVVKENGLLRITAVTSGSAAVTYSWSNGIFVPSFLVDSTIFLQGLTVTVLDTFDHSATATISGDFLASAPIATPDFSYEAFPINNPLLTGIVAIQLVDPQGVVWRSDGGLQNPNIAVFKVLSSEAYEPNEKGDPTRKLEVEFTCHLFNNTGQSRLFTGEGTIAMARN